jgi:hypothetical protein
MAACRKTLDSLEDDRFPCPQYKGITGTKISDKFNDYTTEMRWGMWNLKNSQMAWQNYITFFTQQ